MPLFDGTPLERPVTPDAVEAGGGEPTAGDGAGSQADFASLDVRVRRERRRGKWSAVVVGVVDAATRKALLKTLRSGLGCGGGESGDEIVLQGDCRDAVVERLQGLGCRAKPSGG